MAGRREIQADPSGAAGLGVDERGRTPASGSEELGRVAAGILGALRAVRRLARVIVADASWVIALRDPSDPLHEVAVAVDEVLVEEIVALPQLTFSECLVAPARLGVLDEAAAALRAAFDVLVPDAEAPLRWAELRARENLRLPDAVVLDAALQAGAALVTFDSGLSAAARRRGVPVRSAGADGLG